MRISVIIPTLNEDALIVNTLQSVLAQRGEAEIIVADGSSTDGTRALAAPFARVITARRGRALQMNAGAAQASGDVLLFLHADTLLPPDAFLAIEHTLSAPGAEGGLFRLRFDKDTPLLRLYSYFTHFRWPLFAFGDRGQFVRRSVFEHLGGFTPIPAFEDLEMARMLHQRGGFHYLPQAVVTSSRRFRKNGPLRQQLRNTYLWLHYLLGTDPHHIAHLYKYGNATLRLF